MLKKAMLIDEVRASAFKELVDTIERDMTDGKLASVAIKEVVKK
jgi:hypothetical protein